MSDKLYLVVEFARDLLPGKRDKLKFVEH